MRQKLSLLVLVILIAVLPACGGTTSLDPVTTACEALNQVNDALKFTALVGPDSEILNIVDAQTQLINSWRTLVTEVQKLEADKIPPSLVTANEAFDSIPVANTGSLPAVAAASVASQSQIAQQVVDEFTPVCAAQPAN